MKLKKYFHILLCVISFLFSNNIIAQQNVRGVVLEATSKGVFKPLVGTSVQWLDGASGTVTDTNGVFLLPMPLTYKSDTINKIIISYLGFKSDTIEVNSANLEKVRVILVEDQSSLTEVEITGRNQSSFMDALSPLNTKLMSEKELFKAACCNLSESFETNPSVDVNFADAVTGAKQIQMLGLSGIYTQLTTENLPNTRGLAAIYGLSYVPGTWIESIQVTKGTGSVANGFESIAGQINVEMKKTDITPKMGERLYINTYANDWGRVEGNLNWTQKISSRWATTTMLHANGQPLKIDHHKDGFLDIPLGQQLNAINRWRYDNGKGFLFQAGLKSMYDDRTGGQVNFNKETDKFTTNNYGLGINTKRWEVFAKAGYVFPKKQYQSIGVMASAMSHTNNNYYGLSTYNANQQSIYLNIIYQSVLNNTNHKYRVGISQMIDRYDESIAIKNANDTLGINFLRTEIVPGAFVEYTWTITSKITTIAGLRGDYHNMFGFFTTPRLHGKWEITKTTQLRFSAGRGQRTANILAENSSIFASARQLNITPSLTGNVGKAYGLSPEVAWNYGISLNKEFRFNGKDGSIVFDFYRTDFQNQVVVDYDRNPQQINFYNLAGKSYSNSFQTEINYELLKRLEIRIAYRWYDVKTTYSGTLLARPLIASHRAFANVSYTTRNKWKLDYTINWNGAKRIPSTSTNPENYQFANSSPYYWVMNAQLSKSLGNPNKQWVDIYLGIENLTDFRQTNLIVAADQPFGRYFDTSLIWGPIVGRMWYLGVRYKLK